MEKQQLKEGQVYVGDPGPTVFGPCVLLKAYPLTAENRRLLKRLQKAAKREAA